MMMRLLTTTMIAKPLDCDGPQAKGGCGEYANERRAFQECGKRKGRQASSSRRGSDRSGVRGPGAAAGRAGGPPRAARSQAGGAAAAAQRE